MAPSALNYDPTAIVGDSSCRFPREGCMDSTASNYEPSANVADSALCHYAPIVVGCMDFFASNFNPRATRAASCTYTIRGCTDPAADNYVSAANADDGSCANVVYGCTDRNALNPCSNGCTASQPGSCAYPVPGCRDPTKLNYSPSVTVDDGSCEYPGCMDDSAR